MTTTDRQHTLTSIAADAHTTKRTVQRWLSKAGDIGELQGDTRYFSDAERDTLLSYQSQRKTNDTAPSFQTWATTLKSQAAARVAELDFWLAQTEQPLLTLGIDPFERAASQIR